MTMFNKILIANRGEIACRIIKTAKKLGVKTVAVYSEADAAARHVAMADEAVEIGPAPAKESYLIIENIISAALTTGAEAIHPGYGFLSENAEFAKACEKENIVFIGPPVTAIEAMGSKSAAKTIMEKAKVPLVPGYHGDKQSEDLLRKEADKIGFPILIKASAGGGGKGMRIVQTAEEFDDGLQAAKREAMSSFNDDHVLIEKYLARPRHVEIQVFFDTHGNAVHLFERDCSIQRRHQKVIEEAPAPGMHDKRRDAMGDAAIAAAQAINYVGAGTVEFIVDEDGTFYFMEMNTRLQVEHPVTELISGQDLVEWQLRVAKGETLPCKQSDLSINGHAMEARIYAEDPDNDFLPATGHLTHLRFPMDNKHVRIDTGVRQGDSVTIHYDPMIAKLVVWDHDRLSCLRRMKTALTETQVVGLTTNIDFLTSLVSHQSFQAGEVDTGFIERHHDDLFFDTETVNETVLALAALFIILKRKQESTQLAEQQNDCYSPWYKTNSWQINLPSHETIHLNDDFNEYKVGVHYNVDGMTLTVADKSFTASGVLKADGDMAATLNDTHLHVTVVEQAEQLTLLHSGNNYNLKQVNLTSFNLEDETTPGSLNAPMPGKVIQVLVAQNEEIKKGTPLIILEAMKMEHTITAPMDGTVSIIHYVDGDMVDDGVELLKLEVAE